jgi:glucokinase
MTTILGLDVGGTKIAGLLVNDRDEVLMTRQRPTDGRPLHEQVLSIAHEMLDGELPSGVGIATPGEVDSRSGVVRLAVNVSMPETPLAALVSDALGVPAFVDHDARAAAAWLLAREPATRSLAYVSVGTGIAAAVALDGEILRGDGGLAGEIGHLVAVPDGPRCPCGLRGCLEAVASGPAITRAVAEAVAHGERTGLTADATPADVYRAASEGDPLAARLTREVGAHLARAIRGVALAYGVSRVVIGGGLTRAGDAFLQPIVEELERERDASPLVNRALPSGAVSLLPPDAQAGVWGAVLVARSGLGRTAPEQAARREVGDG